MLSCEEAKNLIEDHLKQRLDAVTSRMLLEHLRTCQQCQRVLEEARLTSLVLQNTVAPPPPSGLASDIKSAALLHLNHRPRPLHERALGSPAFLATCASLVCGAIICMLAIARVGALEPVPAATQSAPLSTEATLPGPLYVIAPHHADVARVPVVHVRVAAVPRHPEPTALIAYRRPVQSPPVLPVRPATIRRHQPRAAAVVATLPVQTASHPLLFDIASHSGLTVAMQRTSLPTAQHTASLVETRPETTHSDELIGRPSLNVEDLSFHRPARLEMIWDQQ